MKLAPSLLLPKLDHFLFGFREFIDETNSEHYNGEVYVAAYDSYRTTRLQASSSIPKTLQADLE